MLTVGLAKELCFLSLVHTSPVTSTIKIGEDVLTLEVDAQKLKAFYAGHHIWTETVDLGHEGISHFGLESCDHIARIIDGINAHDELWRTLVYHQS